MSLYVHQKNGCTDNLKTDTIFIGKVLFDQDFLWHMCLICKTFAGRIFRRRSLQQMWKKKWYCCMQKGKLNSLNMDGFKCAIKIICFPTIGFRWEEFFSWATIPSVCILPLRILTKLIYWTKFGLWKVKVSN